MDGTGGEKTNKPKNRKVLGQLCRHSGGDVTGGLYGLMCELLGPHLPPPPSCTDQETNSPDSGMGELVGGPFDFPVPDYIKQVRGG